MDGLVTGWEINCEVNRLLLDGVPAAGWEVGFSERTRTVASQWAHVHNVRLYHLEKRGKAFLGAMTTFPRGAKPTRKQIERSLDASDAAMGRFLAEVEELGTVKSWPNGPAAFLGYLCAHEAHHRGLVLASLRLAGIKLPKEVTYGMWGLWSKRRAGRLPR